MIDQNTDNEAIKKMDEESPTDRTYRRIFAILERKPLADLTNKRLMRWHKLLRRYNRYDGLAFNLEMYRTSRLQIEHYPTNRWIVENHQYWSKALDEEMDYIKAKQSGKGAGSRPAGSQQAK